MPTPYCRPRRSGFTLIEALVALAVVIILVLIAIPLVYRGVERFKRKACEFNLHRLGEAMQSYRTQFAGSFPTGARFQQSPESPYGPSWWVPTLSHTDQGAKFKGWTNVASSGNFNSKTKNPNIKLADDFKPSFMFCPSSPLRQLNDPLKDISAENRDLLKPSPPHGIPVSSYAAVSGSAPDMLGAKSLNEPHGRNTKDGRLGILSSSGVFPPNNSVKEAAIRDGTGFTIAIVEQSNIWLDSSYDPAVPYDFRSGWPNGAFMGSGANYAQLNPSNQGFDGSGDARAFNCTTLRYKVNTQGLMPGMFSKELEPIPPPKEGEPPRPTKKWPDGPGHNHGVFSPHPGGAQAMFADGSVKWLSDDTELRVILLLSTRDDGQVPEGF